MSFFTPTIAGIALIFMMAAAAALILCTARIKLQRDAHAVRSSRLEDEITALKLELQKRGAERDHLSRTCAELETALQQKEQHLAHMDADVTWHRDQLAKRPPRTRRTYRILTVGLKYTGKTSLTLKWANPLVDLGALKGTKIERYERTVSASTSSDAIVEHVFEIHDWGGEHIVDAQQELILEEIHGVLLVVDLAGKDGAAPDPARIDEQLRAFQPECLRFFFGPKTLATCKTAVLFINKSDVLSGTPAEVERAAMACYQPLIDALSSYRSQMDLRVLVGSASYGHSTHHLFSHFVERILPKSAYDPQLLQRMKSE
ncbi:MAG TPA: hypothetical protein VLS89_08930, partial [Candidatus Nanopelagicales bacterium]|nr:hypothetical protein [Candidatus Nanopelagicales bacterium]